MLNITFMCMYNDDSALLLINKYVDVKIVLSDTR